MILFSNNGEVDTRLITTLGVNVKTTDSAIGYFGTGMKYAIAVLLREKQQIEIWTGQKHITFSLEVESIRGKDFNFIRMHQWELSFASPTSMRLGFTTELGKNWTLDEAYRELHCNSTDEGGPGGQQHFDNLIAIAGEADKTKILVKGDAFDAVHLRRDDFILNTEQRTPLVSTDTCDIYAGRTKTIFYRGIAIRKLEREAAFTYNLKTKLELTEDRTAKYPTYCDSPIGKTLGAFAPAEVIREAIFNKGGYEHEFYGFEWGTVSDTWYATVEQCIEEDFLKVSEHVFKLFFQKEGNEIKRKPYKLTDEQQRSLDEAIVFCQSIGIDPHEYKIRLVESLGRNVYAMAVNETIQIAKKCFEDDLLVEALLEEYIHLRYKVEDFSREMQNVLFKQIIRLGKRTIRSQ